MLIIWAPLFCVLASSRRDHPVLLSDRGYAPSIVKRILAAQKVIAANCDVFESGTFRTRLPIVDLTPMDSRGTRRAEGNDRDGQVRHETGNALGHRPFSIVPRRVERVANGSLDPVSNLTHRGPITNAIVPFQAFGKRAPG
jgi:hypothetical protein